MVNIGLNVIIKTRSTLKLVIFIFGEKGIFKHQDFLFDLMDHLFDLLDLL